MFLFQTQKKRDLAGFSIKVQVRSLCDGGRDVDPYTHQITLPSDGSMARCSPKFGPRFDSSLRPPQQQIHTVDSRSIC